jgi:hypothetical protein
MELPVPRFLTSIDSIVWLPAHPLPPPIAAAQAELLPAAMMAERCARGRS